MAKKFKLIGTATIRVLGKGLVHALGAIGSIPDLTGMLSQVSLDYTSSREATITLVIPESFCGTLEDAKVNLDRILGFREAHLIGVSCSAWVSHGPKPVIGSTCSSSGDSSMSTYEWHQRNLQQLGLSIWTGCNAAQ